MVQENRERKSGGTTKTSAVICHCIVGPLQSAAMACTEQQQEIENGSMTYSKKSFLSNPTGTASCLRNDYAVRLGHPIREN